MLNRRDSSTQHSVRLDLDLDTALLDKEFCLVSVRCCGA